VANFLVVIDPVQDRRERFLNAVRGRLSPVAGLTVHSGGAGDWQVLWAASAAVPVSEETDATGGAMVWGIALPRGGQRSITASELRRQWAWTKTVPDPLDGFHAAVSYDNKLGLICGADVLGQFPIYYYCGADLLLIGSSPELFKHHEAFHSVLDPLGLTGILLMNGLVGGRTLLRGVCRLGTGRLLRWVPGGKNVQEVHQFSISVSDRYHGLPFRAQIEILDEVYRQAIQRHTAHWNDELGILLSGGLDSRTIAGYLNGRSLRAWTFGNPEDQEIQCASAVADSLGIPHHLLLQPGDPLELAHLAVDWEHLAGGFANFTGWRILLAQAPFPPRMVTGHFLDRIMGGPKCEPCNATWMSSMSSFDREFPAFNRWGVPVPLLQRLVRSNTFQHSVSVLMSELRDEYEKSAFYDFHRLWLFDINHRQRFHVARCMWPLGFCSWPLPMLDQEFLNAAGGMPPATISERRAQCALLTYRFPQLAALPLDNNSGDPWPLQPKLRTLIGKAIKARLPKLPRGLRRERRTWYHIYNFNNPEWKAIRRHADQYRQELDDILDHGVLNEVLPPPEVDVKFNDAISETVGMKLLIGFMIWAKRHIM
jgi:asparagine synthase (glutamine-hydrolysing)